MTFQARYRFSSRSGLFLRFIQICAIIGFIAPWATLANSTIPIFSQDNELVQHSQNENSSTFENITTLNAVSNNSSNKNETMLNNIKNDEEETTFLPETILFQLSDRKNFDYFEKKNNTKFIIKKKMLNATNYYKEPVKALGINSNELPVEKKRKKHPEHKLSKNPVSINLESRMLFDRNEE